MGFTYGKVYGYLFDWYWLSLGIDWNVQTLCCDNELLTDTFYLK